MCRIAGMLKREILRDDCKQIPQGFHMASNIWQTMYVDLFRETLVVLYESQYV